MSRLRRLRNSQGGRTDPGGGPGGIGTDGLRLRDRLRGALSLLPLDLRLSRHPRPRAVHRHGHQAGQSGPGRLGRVRRRRWPVDRRQPCPARAQAQCRSADPPVQQRDLWSDQRPVFADLAAGHALAVDAHGLARITGLGGRLRAGLRGALRRPLGRHPATASAGRLEAGARIPGRRFRRDLPELYRLQRRRVRRLHRALGRGRRTGPRRTRPAAHLRPRAGQGPAPGDLGAGARGPATRRRRRERGRRSGPRRNQARPCRHVDRPRAACLSGRTRRAVLRPRAQLRASGRRARGRGRGARGRGWRAR